MTVFIDKLLEPHSTDDWLDRRAALEADKRKEAHLRFAQDWLAKNHPRHRGRAA